jgi:hypothetical protein
LNLNDVGQTSLQESNAFKKISIKSKASSGKLFSLTSFIQAQESDVQNLNFSDNLFFKSSNYTITRQHSLVSASTLANNHKIGLDFSSFYKYLNINYQTLKNERTINASQNILFHREKIYSLVEDKMFMLLKQLSFKNSLGVQTLFRDFKNLTNRETSEKFGIEFFDPMVKEFNVSFLNSTLLDTALTKSQNLLSLTGINLKSGFERTSN